MTKEEFNDIPWQKRPPKRNITLEQFIAEQDAKADKFDYEGTFVSYGGDESYRVPWHLRREDHQEAWELGYLEPETD